MNGRTTIKRTWNEHDRLLWMAICSWLCSHAIQEYDRGADGEFQNLLGQLDQCWRLCVYMDRGQEICWSDCQIGIV